MSTAENRAVLKDGTGADLIVGERTTLLITATLKDEGGVVIPAAAFSTLKLTLYNRDDAAKTIIAGISAVNILNTGRGTVHASSGLLTLTLLPDDNVIVDVAQELEWHRALIEWTYSAGAKAGKHEIDFQLRNLSKVT